MFRRVALAVLSVLVVPGAAAAAPLSTSAGATGWRALAGAPDRAPGQRVETRPQRFEAFALDKPRLRAVLDRRTAVLSVPAPDGSLERFRVKESPVLAPALARRFPQIRTYAGESLDRPGTTGRFDLGPLGFHASVSSPRGLWYVDPYFKGGDGAHVAYYRTDLARRRSPLAAPGETEQLGEVVRRAAPRKAPGEPVVRRVYRLALANDPSYAEYFGSTDLLVETAKAALINRVNQLYNDDLAIRMELVADDFLLNFATTEEYTAAGYGDQACDGALLDQNQAAIDRIIGDADYDVGHIVKRAGGGGIAALDSVGQPGIKAQGCTGLDPPVGDGFAIDYVAHELGHQFGGPHTFDGNQGNCAPPNRELIGTVSVEPGSGSSIQAYAGICADDDLQANSDPYFSQSSIDSINAYITSDIAGATEEGTPSTVANRNPTVTAPADKTIPVQTPFTLTGSGTDPDAGDNLVYLWEQNDADFPSPFGTALSTPPGGKTQGPLFRIFGTAAVEDPLQSPAPGQNVAKAADRTRTFPDPAQVAADNTDAETGLCPPGDVECNSEVLPTASYALNPNSGELNFRLTARDRSPVGGGIAHDDVTLTLDPLSGPFAVTGPAGPQAFTGGQDVTVTWNVAGTAGGSVNTPDVRISYSTDGGLSFGYEVLATTANDGTETVTLPNVTTTGGRFKVEAVGNYFFDVSDGNLAVAQDVNAPVPSPTPTPEPEPSPAPTVQPIAVPGAPTPSPSPRPNGGGTPTPGPSVTATPTATPRPGSASIRPDLRLTRKRIRVTRRRTFRVIVRCRVIGRVGVPRRCRGSVKVRGARRRALSVAPGGAKRITLRLTRRSYRALRGKRRRVTVRATLGGRKATKRIILRRR